MNPSQSAKSHVQHFNIIISAILVMDIHCFMNSLQSHCTSDIDDDEVILAGKEGDSNDDDDCTSNNEDIVAVGEVEIISVQQSMKWKSKSTTPDSVAKTGT